MQSPTGGDQLRRSKCRGPEASEGSSEGRSPRPRLMTHPPDRGWYSEQASKRGGEIPMPRRRAGGSDDPHVWELNPDLLPPRPHGLPFKERPSGTRRSLPLNTPGPHRQGPQANPTA